MSPRTYLDRRAILIEASRSSHPFLGRLGKQKLRELEEGEEVSVVVRNDHRPRYLTSMAVEPEDNDVVELHQQFQL